MPSTRARADRWTVAGSGAGRQEHALGRVGDIAPSIVRREAMATGQPGAALGDVDLAHGRPCHALSLTRSVAGRAAGALQVARRCLRPPRDTAMPRARARTCCTHFTASCRRPRHRASFRGSPALFGRSISATEAPRGSGDRRGETRGITPHRRSPKSGKETEGRPVTGARGGPHSGDMGAGMPEAMQRPAPAPSPVAPGSRPDRGSCGLTRHGRRGSRPRERREGRPVDPSAQARRLE